MSRTPSRTVVLTTRPSKKGGYNTHQFTVPSDIATQIIQKFGDKPRFDVTLTPEGILYTPRPDDATPDWLT